MYATAELAPVASVGGLAAAAAGLTAELRRQGAEVDIVMPDYGPGGDGVALADEEIIELEVPSWVGHARVRVGEHPRVGRLHLVEVPGMQRSHPYLRPDGEGWTDNDHRFFAFSQAIAALVRRQWPDVLHLNDWHTGAVLAALDPAPPTVLSVHNLAYQGHAAGGWLAMLGPRAEHYEWWGGTNALTGAIALADRVVAVSPHYVSEILTPEGGFGVDLPLRQRRGVLSGILNGIDTDTWNPATDPFLPARYDRTDLTGKDACRSALSERVGFPDDEVPLATVVTRLTNQKGIDLLAPLVPLLAQVPLRVAVLGSGDAALAAHLHRLAADHAEHFAFHEGYDEALSHLMFAGADLYLMPSRFEPCGLTQMQAMQYGTIPVVTAVGGLVDTVPDVDDDPKHGLGFVAGRADTTELLAAIFRAARRIKDRRRRATLQRRGMAVDWSWRQPAAEHLAMYAHLAGHD
jgi:starch synthase